MTTDGPHSDKPAQPEELPNRLRVHSLARVLGTTSRRVLDALIELDGRVRSAHSAVDRVDAVKVRDLLEAAEAAEAAAAAAPVAADAPAEPAAAEPAPAEPAVAEPAPVATEPAPAADEPAPVAPAAVEQPSFSHEQESQPQAESAPATGSAGFMPLFVAPQAVVFEPPVRTEAPAAAPAFAAPAPGEEAVAEDEAADEEASRTEADEDDDEERPANRRRRRGRRGRGRGRGTDGAGGDEGEEAPAAEGGEDAAAEPAAEAETGETDEAEESEEADEAGAADESGNRRRRRRRRRKSGDSGDEAESGSPDDPPNTVVHERAPRAAKAGRSGKGTGDDEIQGITGSTRLEAKRQRRRDGRDAGRRRPPILSEAEFLARREAVERVMVVRDRVRTEPPHQGSRYTQIAVLEDGVMVEHFVTSAASASMVGNVYLGVVQNVLPSMEAAFVDIGRGRNGVLYAGEVNWEAAGLGGSNRKIEQALKPGDYVVVQVSKDPIGHKGARLTTQVSLAGRYLVYVPGASSTGISRKLPDTERQRLKEILREVVPADAGVIIRTASEGVKEEDIRTDVNRLQQRWSEIEATAEETRKKAAGAAVALYEEPDVLVKVIRDLFNEDFSKLIVSGEDAWSTITEYVESVAPELMSKLTRYEAACSDGVPGPDVFAVHRIDEQLAKAMDRKVWLPSGGTLVIDRTEAMTVVDVNTGKFTGSGGNLEETVTKNNLEAAEEIVRQLRLRDIGGIIVIDFIDMVLESNRDLVLRRLTEALGRDRTRHQVSEVTSLGLVQLTRKRLGTGLIEAFSTNCQACAGRGIVLHADPVDSAAPGRKAEPGTGRRSKRGKKAKVEEQPPTPVATLPAHTPGDHPMFKAMAAANGHHDEEAGEGEPIEPVEGAEEPTATGPAVEVEETDEADDSGADFDNADEDDDEDEDVEVEVDLDDENDDEEYDVIDGEADEDDDDSEDGSEDEDDEDTEDSDAADEVAEEVVEVASTRPRRRRAAARPAGPPR